MLNLHIINTIHTFNSGKMVMIINGLPNFADSPYLNEFGLTGRIYGSVYLPNHDIGDPKEWEILGQPNDVLLIEEFNELDELCIELPINSLILLKK